MAHPGYPTAGGTPTFTGGLIPEIFPAKFNIEFYKDTVLTDITNTDYEGAIKESGDKVTVPTYPSIVSRPYVKGQDLIYTELSPGTVTLLIDQGRYFAFPVANLDTVQASMEFADKWAKHGSMGQSIEIDEEVLSYIYTQAHAANQGIAAGVESGNINIGGAGAPLQFTLSNSLATVLKLDLVLTEQQVPKQGRWVVLPPWAVLELLLSDLKNASITNDRISPLRNGLVGQIGNMTIYESSSITTATDTAKVWNCPFGHKLGTSFATQLIKDETIVNQNDFGDLHRMLQVYGRSVMKPEAVGLLYIKQ